MTVVSANINLESTQSPLILNLLPFEQSIIRNCNLICVGDLHGNYIKLFSALIHFDFIWYANTALAEYQYNELLNLEKMLAAEFTKKKDPFYSPRMPGDMNFSDGEVVSSIIKNFFRERFIFFPHQKHIVFIGDTICDRGISDFITLCLFELLDEFGIQYTVLCGNHEMCFANTKTLSDNPKLHTYTPQQWDFFFHSYDFFRLTLGCQIVYKRMYENFLKKISVFKILIETGTNHAILLTHAPCTTDQFTQLIKYIGEEPTALFNIGTYVLLQERFNSILRENIIDIAKGKINYKTYAFKEVIDEFVGNRNMRGPSFFESLPKDYNTIGHHVFGHMAGAENLPIRKFETCLDTSTGKPEHYSGPVIYECFNVYQTSLTPVN